MCSTYIDNWSKYINGDGRESNKLRTYCKLKETNFGREKYLGLNLPIHKRKLFTKLRISAHNLHIEQGRYNKTDRKSVV